MSSRNRRRSPNTPGYVSRVLGTEEVLVPNRKIGQKNHAQKRQAPGNTVREELNNIRKRKMAGARRVIRAMRKATKQAMKRMAGL